jgi:hypothetical protein
MRESLTYFGLKKTTMPNHIKNRLTINGAPDAIKKMLSLIAAPEGRPIDFERIIPQPDNLFREDLSIEDEERCKRLGIPDWYSWNTKKWGTKWNAYEADLEGNVLTFETAWCCPVPIVHAIANQYPELTINWDYADEDTGSNVGRWLLKDGLAHLHEIENGSNEAFELAFELRPNYASDYKKVDGRYVYIEE